MYSVIVEAGFTAMHQIRLHDGTVEPRHGHDWGVRAVFSRPTLDELGMVIDFSDARRMLAEVLDRLDYKDLNQHPAFRDQNPTTEVVAHWIFGQMVELGATTLSEIEVTEAPGCRAAYRPSESLVGLLRSRPD